MLEDVRVKWCQFCVFLGPVISRLSHCIAALFLRMESVLMGDSLSRCWIRSHRREMMTQCIRTPAVGVPLTSANALLEVLLRTVTAWLNRSDTNIVIGNNIIGPLFLRYMLQTNQKFHHICYVFECMKIAQEIIMLRYPYLCLAQSSKNIPKF